MTVRVFAPAKVNLTLHVTGRRPDGYHLLDSLVAFAPVGDELLLEDAGALSLAVEGPEAAGVPATMDNLVMRAAVLTGHGRGAALRLTKALPVASGIGGGSSDAAAAARGMLALTSRPGGIGPGAPIREALEGLGADIPMCLDPRPWRVRGIGERLDPVELPPLPAVLVNPRLPVPTPSVFRALRSPDNPPMPEVLPGFPDAAALIAFLAHCRNDLEAPALSVEPAIGTVLGALRAVPGARLARMSGSGATCFALFHGEAAAVAAARRIASDHPGWWVAHGVLGDQSARAAARVS